MTRSESNASFKRRKFTITEVLDGVLEELADQNYQGNVSLCLRAAIEDHRETLNGTGSELVTQQLLQQADEIISRQDRIIEALENLEDDSDQGAAEVEPSFQTGGVSNDGHRILVILEAAETELRIEDLAEQLDLPASRIQPTLGTLLDRGLITSNGESPTRFRLAGRSHHNDQGI